MGRTIDLLLYQLLQPIIPVLSKLAHHRPFEELPQRNALVLSLAFSGHADAPFVVKDVREAIFLDQANGIEMA